MCGNSFHVSPTHSAVAGFVPRWPEHDEHGGLPTMEGSGGPPHGSSGPQHAPAGGFVPKPKGRFSIGSFFRPHNDVLEIFSRIARPTTENLPRVEISPRALHDASLSRRVRGSLARRGVERSSMSATASATTISPPDYNKIYLRQVAWSAAQWQSVAERVPEDLGDTSPRRRSFATTSSK